MMNKINEKMLRDAVEKIDPSKLSEMKKTLENPSEVSNLLQRLDPQKVQKTLNALGSNVAADEIAKLIGTLSQNPDMLKELKNHL